MPVNFTRAVLHGRKAKEYKNQEDAEDMILYKESFARFSDEQNPSSERDGTISSYHRPDPRLGASPTSHTAFTGDARGRLRSQASLWSCFHSGFKPGVTKSSIL